MPRNVVVSESARTGRAARVRVRMYRQGLGDCFLLTFDPDSERPGHLLIDCGTLGEKTTGVKMDDVVRDVLAATGGKLDAVVATHEHQDHVSGFPALARKEGLRVSEVWAAWTENPEDLLAQDLEKYRGDLLGVAALAVNRLEAEAGSSGESAGARVREVLGFSGVEGSPLAAGGLKHRADEAMKAALGLVQPRHHVFCSPGDVLERPWAPGARFFVLGPPRDRAALRRLGEHGSPDLYDLALATRAWAAGADAAAPASPPADEDEQRYPFDVPFRVPASETEVRGGVAGTYDEEGAAWRRIDHDWLSAASDFALQLDNLTNNTSLVLAIEVAGRVLLFPGDAQLGSWLSWEEVSFSVDDGAGARRVCAPDLLRRTVFYKVGHHASHNATATTGLELMEGPGLTAFIPLDGRVAEAKGWRMPAHKLEARLLLKTSGRTIRSDVPDAAAAAAADVQVTRLHVDWELPEAQARTGFGGSAPRAPPSTLDEITEEALRPAATPQGNGPSPRRNQRARPRSRPR